MKTSIKGIPVELVVAKYQELGNVWKVGEYFGITGQLVYSHLKEIGVVTPMNKFSKDDERVLLEKYEEYKKQGRLQELADELGRTKQFICRKAGELGLTSRVKSYDFSEEKRQELSNSAKRRIKKYGHPRGALGMVHSDEAKRKMSIASKRNWEIYREERCSEEKRKRRSDLLMHLQEEGRLGVRSRCYLSDVCVGGKTFLAKSSWEYDVALYFESLKGQSLITDWEYEPKVFRFKYNTLGVRTYRPDFSVIRGDRVYYIEVKGWRDRKANVKQKLMESEFPDVRILYIGERQYRLIKKKYGERLVGWGTMKDLAGREKKLCGIDGCMRPAHSKGLCRHHFYEKYKK